MKFNEAWLKEWIDPGLATDELVHQLTMAGLEVDAVEPAAEAFSGVVVAEVRDTRPHPEADKLTLCTVHDGDIEVQVVCGASNVRPGLRVPFARVGAELPGDLKIRRAKLRGEESHGMLCGASELGLEDLVDGLLELPADAPVGMDFRAYLALDDNVIDVDLTPNRADCLSVRGIARELGVLTQQPVSEPACVPVPPQVDDVFPVRVMVPAACPRYLGRVVRNIRSDAVTPLWMVERLRRAGLRSLGPVVDVTNYVLLELGQPLHAFDLAKLQGGIEVRNARAGESLRLLDGQDVTLRDDTLVIADESRALAMAGIMGGEYSAVGTDTRDIFLECAFFAPLAVAGKARSYGLHTDSSHRYERGVDPALQEMALERATQLLLDIVGGQPGPVVKVEDPAHVPAPASIVLRRARIGALLGVDFADAAVEDILRRLGMTVSVLEEGVWQVRAPSWRFDMEREEDLIEELARVHGYARLPTRLPAVRADARVPEDCTPLRRLADALQDRGYLEVITYSFVDPALQAQVDSHEALPLANPISRELGVMRTTLLAGLLGCARYNLNRQADRLRLFESGLRFRPGPDGLVQEPMLAGLVHGPVAPHWESRARSADFYDIKGDVEALLALTGHTDWTFHAISSHPTLHPGQAAEIRRGDEVAGWIGRIHPGVAAALELPDDVFVFELRTAVIGGAHVPRFAPLSDQPAVRRDLAFVLPGATAAGDVVAAVRRAAGEALTEVRIFDVYQGERLPAGSKSLALGLTFQDRSRTLGEADISSLVDAVVSLLKQEFNAHLRD